VKERVETETILDTALTIELNTPVQVLAIETCFMSIYEIVIFLKSQSAYIGGKLRIFFYVPKPQEI